MNVRPEVNIVPEPFADYEFPLDDGDLVVGIVHDDRNTLLSPLYYKRHFSRLLPDRIAFHLHPTPATLGERCDIRRSDEFRWS